MIKTEKMREEITKSAHRANATDEEIEELLTAINDEDYLKLQEIEEELERRDKQMLEDSLLYHDIYRIIAKDSTERGMIENVDWIELERIRDWIKKNENIDYINLVKNPVFTAEQLIDTAKSAKNNSLVAGYKIGGVVNDLLEDAKSSMEFAEENRD